MYLSTCIVCIPFICIKCYVFANCMYCVFQLATYRYMPQTAAQTTARAQPPVPPACTIVPTSMRHWARA